ncbi:hypothetical protein ASE27_10095 [Oerskovia sp. Root918]|uniref:M23 family metallopeptidase n=1 Tax=Oerskovia sp. Root918 TaxID=1736607 RepID=UPI0006F7841F|nr:M23 family metallopeptidase [Oerskovia sp. Root918]KRD36797.1 hypothetical protein ASE27_10095 [Oerskovia sp. Root918]
MSWHRPNAPSGPITSPFGPRGPIANAPNASRNHLGVDLRAGTLGVTSDIYAATAGTVRRIYKTPLNAWVLELDHGSKVWTRYAHMQRVGIAVAVGAKVVGGQRVAAASNSGAPTVHLHFEVLINGVQVDPVSYLRARGIDLTTTTVAKPGGGTGGPITTPTIPGRPAPITPEDDMDAAQNAALADIYSKVPRILQILEAFDPQRPRLVEAADRVMGVLPNLRTPDGRVATVLTTAEGQILRDDIAASTARAVAETSSAFHQLVARVDGIETGEIDIDHLATALRTTLGDAVVEALAERLKGA